MKGSTSTDWVPGIESETRGKGVTRSLLFSSFVSVALFFLLPLSEFVRTEEWIVREIDSPPFETPPPPKTKLEKKVEELVEKAASPRPLESKPNIIQIEALSANLEVGPGDYQAEFSLLQYNPVASGFQGDLFFNLHELDRNPNVLKRGNLRYPPHLKRRGLEGEVKLLVQIDEKGKVKVLEVASFTHPDFVEPSRKAAEGSTYEPPKRNGEAVKVQFYLPVRYSLLDQ